MSNGYSHNMVLAVRAADPQLLGVKLGQVCIDRDIPVGKVAKVMGVSRLTIYHWFLGKFKPRPEQHEKITRFIAENA